MFFSEDGWYLEADETLENELRLAQAKRTEAERFSGPLTAKLSDMAEAVSAAVGLEAISKGMQTCAVAQRHFEGYVLKEPVAQEEIRPRVSALQALNERVREHELFQAVEKAKFEEFARLDARDEWEAGKAAPVVAVEPEPLNGIIHSTKARRDTLTPVIELAQSQCRNSLDTAEVWAALQILAEKKIAPLIGGTEDGLQYLKGGNAEIFKRKSLGQRLAR